MIRSFVIRWVLRLYLPPFVWVYHFYYWLAIQLSRMLLSRVAGVRSLYLTGSWVRRDLIYGLSDVDFKVFVSGDKNRETHDSIRRRFSWLRRFFPILGNPDEKGVYFLDSFEADYRRYPLVQHLFDPRYFKHRRLWGEDLIPSLPLQPWEALDQDECAFARLKDWIERVYLITNRDGWSAPHKQHLYFKAVSDVALLAIRAGNPDFSFSRRSEILHTIAHEMEEPYSRWIRNLLVENRLRYRKQYNSDDENFRLFKKVVSCCLERISGRNNSPPVPLKTERSFSPRCNGQDPVADRLRSFSSSIREVTVVPWAQLPIHPLDFQLFGCPVYVLKCSAPLTLPEFQALRSYCRKVLRNAARVVLMEYEGWLSTVDADFVEHWGGFSGSSDLMQPLLLEDAARPMTQDEDRRIRRRTAAFREQLAALLDDPESGRISLRFFPAFLFNALRALNFDHEFGIGKWCWLPDADAVADFLFRRTPLDPAFVRKLAQQYAAAAGDGGSFDERLLPKSRALLSETLEVTLHRRPWNDLEKLNAMADEARLGISAAVVTFYRPKPLERCLNSIARLTRTPSELIIVAESSDTASREIVENLRFPFPMRFLAGDRLRIGAARNMAARAAKGDLIVFIDDDACVSPDWLDLVERAFLRDSRIGLVSGAVLNLRCGRRDSIWKFMQVMEKL